MGLKVFAGDIGLEGAGGEATAGRDGAGSGVAQASLEPQASMLEKLACMAEVGVGLGAVGWTEGVRLNAGLVA